MIKEDLEQTVTRWEQVGYPALLERFVLRNGKAYQPRRRVGRKQANKQCFKNAANFVIRHGFGQYVEGYGLRPGLFPMHHAWVDLDGKVMDPTWADSKDCEYYGVPVDTKVLLEQLSKNKVYGIFDLGMINTNFLFQIDPDLKAILDEFLERKKTI